MSPSSSARRARAGDFAARRTHFRARSRSPARRIAASTSSVFSDGSARAVPVGRSTRTISRSRTRTAITALASGPDTYARRDARPRSSTVRSSRSSARSCERAGRRTALRVTSKPCARSAVSSASRAAAGILGSSRRGTARRRCTSAAIEAASVSGGTEGVTTERRATGKPVAGRDVRLKKARGRACALIRRLLPEPTALRPTLSLRRAPRAKRYLPASIVGESRRIESRRISSPFSVRLSLYPRGRGARERSPPR